MKTYESERVASPTKTWRGIRWITPTLAIASILGAACGGQGASTESVDPPAGATAAAKATPASSGPVTASESRARSVVSIDTSASSPVTLTIHAPRGDVRVTVPSTAGIDWSTLPRDLDSETIQGSPELQGALMKALQVGAVEPVTETLDGSGESRFHPDDGTCGYVWLFVVSTTITDSAPQTCTASSPVSFDCPPPKYNGVPASGICQKDGSQYYQTGTQTWAVINLLPVMGYCATGLPGTQVASYSNTTPCVARSYSLCWYVQTSWCQLASGGGDDDDDDDDDEYDTFARGPVTPGSHGHAKTPVPVLTPRP